MRYRIAHVALLILVALVSLGTSHGTTAYALDTQEQYRQWMEEARVQYPYRDSLATMRAVMLCESGGNPNAIGARGRYLGLFQYARGTWSGAWNPYRNQSIFDPQAQILATAKAWYDGHQRWWGCYR